MLASPLDGVSYGDVPKWLKGPDSKSGRSVPPALGFKSPHLRHINDGMGLEHSF